MKKELPYQAENFIHNISWLRKHYAIPKNRMAKLLGISTKSLDVIEKGQMPPKVSAEVILMIEKHFCHELNDFFTRRFGEE